MDEPKTTSIAIKTTLYEQVTTLAQELDLLPNDLVEQAIQAFITTQSEQGDIPHKVVVKQGDIYWAHSESEISHPHLIIQDDLLNHSRIKTVVACALTTNMKKVNVQGNVLLEIGEANLSKQSIVESAKLVTLHKAHLGEYIGTLSEQRVNQVLASLRFLQQSYFKR